jgi:hypothetical protein
VSASIAPPPSRLDPETVTLANGLAPDPAADGREPPSAWAPAGHGEGLRVTSTRAALAAFRV